MYKVLADFSLPTGDVERDFYDCDSQKFLDGVPVKSWRVALLIPDNEGHPEGVEKFCSVKFGDVTLYLVVTAEHEAQISTASRR